MFMWHRHGGLLGVAFAHARSKERGGVGCVIVVRLGPAVVGSEPRARVCRQVLLPGLAYAVVRSNH